MTMKTDNMTSLRHRKDALTNDILIFACVHHVTVCQWSARTACSVSNETEPTGKRYRLHIPLLYSRAPFTGHAAVHRAQR